MGGDEIKKKFADLREEQNEQFEAKKNEIFREINEQENKIGKDIDSNKPQVPLFNKLPAKKQK